MSGKNWLVYMDGFGQWYAVEAHEDAEADDIRIFATESEACTNAIRRNEEAADDLESRIRRLQAQREWAILANRKG